MSGSSYACAISSPSREISESSVKAADSFVDLCLQHATYLGGRGDFQEAVDDIQQGKLNVRFAEHFV